jgi:hypothetical protein
MFLTSPQDFLQKELSGNSSGFWVVNLIQANLVRTTVAGRQILVWEPSEVAVHKGISLWRSSFCTLLMNKEATAIRFSPSLPGIELLIPCPKAFSMWNEPTPEQPPKLPKLYESEKVPL